MNGNICPKCGKPVMSYKRFFREAEPYKISTCDHCDSRLRRNPIVYLFLVVMIVLLCIIAVPLFFSMVKANISFWIIFPIMIVLTAAWSVLINYFAWRLIGWKLVVEKNKPSL